LAPLHLLALLHNHARRPDSTNCDGFFSSPECSSRSASFDDFGDGGCGGDDAVVDAEEQQLRDELASSTTASLSSSSSSSSSSSTTWTSTDSGEWSDWEDPLWVKDDNLLHSCDRDRRRISPAAVVEPAAGQASGDSSSPQPARRPTTTKKKTTNKAKRNRRRKRQQAVVRPASTAEQPTEPAHSAAALTERRGSAVDEEEEEGDDDELVWRKRIGVEALEVQTEELRLSVAEDPVAAAAAVVLDLALDSPFSSADEVAAISPPVPIPPTSPTATAIAPKNPEAEWREAGVALMHNSEAAFRLPERPSDGSRRTTSVDVASSSSAPMPATPCLVELDGESLSTGRHRAPPPRPPRAFAPAASDGALTLAKRPRAPTAMATTTTAEMSWATARESLPVVMLSSGGGSRLRDMQLIREMIDEQQHRVAARKKRSKQAMAPATNSISTSQETTRLSTTTKTTKKNEKKTKKKKNENDGKKKDSYEGKRGKLKRKTKLWNSLRRLKEKTAGGGEGNGDGGGDGGVANNNNMADIGQVYVAAMANKGVRASAAAIPTRRTTKPAPKNEVEENASAKKNEAKEKVVEKEMNDEADVGEVLSLSSASGHVMKVPVLNMTGLGSPASPTTATSTSPTSTTSWLVSSASMSAVPLSPGQAYDATPRPTSTAGVAHRPRNVSDPTGGSASSTLSSAESLSPRRRVWQAMTTPVVAAAGNRFRRNSRRFDHATSAAAEPLEWVASPLLDLLRQRQLGHHQQQPPQLARRQLRDYRTRSLHLPESPVAAAAQLDHLADGERTLQSTA
jgi:hypothetical protein